MKTTLTRATLTLLTIVGTLILVVSNGLGNRQDKPSAQSPSGNWSISAIPYIGPGYKSRPVVVTSVMSNSSNGFKVTHVVLKNISSKPAAAVRLSWSIYNDKANSILLRGQTALITLSKEIPENTWRQVKHDIFSAETAKPLANEGGLDGHYRIEVGVSEILFAGGSTWIVDRIQPDEAAFIKTSLSKSSALLRVTPLSLPQFCPKQGCSFVPGPPSGFTCGDSGNNTVCTNCGTSCCNTLCGQPACDCGPDT